MQRAFVAADHGEGALLFSRAGNTAHGHITTVSESRRLVVGAKAVEGRHAIQAQGMTLVAACGVRSPRENDTAEASGTAAYSHLVHICG